MNVLLTEALKQFNLQVVQAQKVIQSTDTVINKIIGWAPVTASDAVYVYADLSTGAGAVAGAYVSFVYYRTDVSIGIQLVKRATELL